jgi:protein transport protein SEC24
VWLQVYLQCALLYTTTDGARRVRVSTLALPVSDQMGAVFKGADLDSQLASLTRQVSSSSSSSMQMVCSLLLTK